MADAIWPILAAKQFGSDEFLAPLIVEACLSTASSSGSGKKSINPDAVRVTKILGGRMD